MTKKTTTGKEFNALPALSSLANASLRVVRFCFAEIDAPACFAARVGSRRELIVPSSSTFAWASVYCPVYTRAHGAGCPVYVSRPAAGVRRVQATPCRAIASALAAAALLMCLKIAAACYDTCRQGKEKCNTVDECLASPLG
ncbi:hypothetical protein MTO96_024224 [Rhipicephalus appendiculatus]